MAGRRNRRRQIPAGVFEASIENLTHDGRGTAHVEGKAVFIDGALAQERVTFRYTGLRKDYATGQVVEVLDASPFRVAPKCVHTDICGGCSLQHINAEHQIELKQSLLLESLRRIGKTQPASVLAPLQAQSWGYRRKARLGVKYVRKKGKVLVGFRERNAPYVAELSRCEVLHPSVGERLTALAQLIEQLSIFDQIPQIEVAIGDAQVGLILRHLQPFSEADLLLLRQFAQQYEVVFYLQPKGPDTVRPLESAPPLYYDLAAYALRLEFSPTDFTQVNAELNQRMIGQALDLLQLSKADRVLDLFCGLGNFTLPLARSAGAVVGVEGDAQLIEQAKSNAALNGVDNATFYVADLTQDSSGTQWMQQRYTKVLLDPPRSGAKELIATIVSLNVTTILYVSCNPSTLARDTDLLVNEHGYRLQAAGVMDMFPHTAHVESMALFVR